MNTHHKTSPYNLETSTFCIILLVLTHYYGMGADQAHSDRQQVVDWFMLSNVMLSHVNHLVYAVQCYIVTCKSSLPVVKPFSLLGHY